MEESAGAQKGEGGEHAIRKTPVLWGRERWLLLFLLCHDVFMEVFDHGNIR
jgi:hypothetical protein